MKIFAEKISDINNNKEVKTDKKNQSYQMLFDYKLNKPEDGLLKNNFWSDNSRALLLEATQEMEIGSYSLELLKTDNDAIRDSQKHLIGLIKYYEGDRNYYYEPFIGSYLDNGGTATSGFGDTYDVSKSQEDAYAMLAKKLPQYSNEVKRFVNKIMGKGAYDKLPNSIKEGLTDLCYNKGNSAVTKNKNLTQALKEQNYSKVVKNLVFLHSNKKNADKTIIDPGLYRRSLSRVILATRDLSGVELAEAKKEIDGIYKNALNVFNNHNPAISTVELKKIYEQFTQNKITTKPHSAESYKFQIGDKYKSRGIWGIAKDLYDSAQEKDLVSFEVFKDALIRMNYPKEYVEKKSIQVKIGQVLRVPFIENLVKSDTTDLVKETSNSEKTSNVAQCAKINEQDKEDVGKVEAKQVVENEKIEKKEKKGFWTSVWNGVKKAVKAVINFFKNLFSDDEADKNDQVDLASLHDHETAFQRMLKKEDVKFEDAGDLLVATYNHKVKKGDNLYALSREYGFSVEKICNDNHIKNKNSIDVGQNIKLQKLAYKVKKGDNLYQISKKFGLTTEILKDLNNIQDVNKINIDEMIEIPGFIYEVNPKDTLYKISKKVGVSIQDLKNINQLTSDNINPGQKIIIIYNDPDYAISNEKKKVTIDPNTKVKTEIVDMSSNDLLASRPLLQKKRKVNGLVMATRAVFESTKTGKLSGKTIIVNAGHGYSQAETDPGALSRGDIDDEWLINYDNAIRLKDRLCAQGAKVIFLQGHVNLITKELIKKENKADLFFSVHVNSFDGKTKDRTQIYRSKNKLDVNNKSKRLADTIEKNFDKWIKENETIAPDDRFIDHGKQDYAQSRSANYAVIREAEKKQNIPAVLWEIAFMVSPKGRERMKDPVLMNHYSDLMSQSIVEYFS